jgi:DNA-binding LacI/PurR family transcriptional regulator
MVRGASDVLVANGYHPLLFSCDEDSEQEQEALRVAAEQRVAGLILSPTRRDSQAYEWLVTLGIRLVCMDRSVPGLSADVVRSDDATGFRKATEYLIGKGHSRVAMVSGPTGSAVSVERIQGYRDALVTNGIALDDELILEGASKESFGYEALLRLAALERPPTAVVAASTRLTLGVLYAMRDHDIDRPEQMTVVGSGSSDVEWMSLFDPPVTAVALKSRVFGQKAAELLVARIAGQRCGLGEEFIVESELAIRE